MKRLAASSRSRAEALPIEIERRRVRLAIQALEEPLRLERFAERAPASEKASDEKLKPLELAPGDHSCGFRHLPGSCAHGARQFAEVGFAVAPDGSEVAMAARERDLGDVAAGEMQSRSEGGAE